MRQIMDKRGLRNSPTSQSQSGFTITELLIVLTLIGILSAISMPTLRGFAVTRRLKASAYTIRSQLTFARDMAITDRTPYLVVFDLDNGRCWLASSETFNPSTPLASTLTAQNSTAAIAAQNNTNANSLTTTNAVQQETLTRTGGILGVPYPMERDVTLAAMVTNRNGRTLEVNSGVGYIAFSPKATSEQALIYLRNTRNQVMSVTVEAASGRVTVQQLAAEDVEMLGFETPQN
ncbi:prepilin-type N-terminal cleavage/methylation domain-containing protein [Candidatus Poribacteria bacterium]|nr:prepilin-type N-terminal cleavage/methylation domain-containing protein [Candidatus Poribacteria bacterium]MYG07638.1 prepilin-type N-terminal cleavage/methylation domain-containing protein [Candidatus Poribacteria bacterium]MYK21218.1 prepilin-type N-terminal cleavage/methylation domain-containing protein [Candidatus Poribacteria bacterium]